MPVSVRVDTSAFAKSLRKAEGQLSEALIRAMGKSIEQLREESQALAPYKTGELQGNVNTNVSADGKTVTGEVQFNVPYASRQHNDLDLRPGPGTQAKPQTRYGTPGQNYLLNPAVGLGRDQEYHKHIKEELER